MGEDEAAEVERLKAELAEARQALDAIRNGSLDAVLTSVPDAAPLYTRTSAERIYRLIIERMLEGAVTIDESGTILHCNRMFAQMLGRPESEIVGQPIEAWLTEHEEVSVDELLHGVESQRGDFDIEPATGPPIPVSVSAASITDDGGSVRCLVVSDLRMRKDVSRLRAMRDELAIANRRKDEFLAMLGHELRNPLAPVRQAVELLQANATEDDPDFLRRARSVIARQIVHLTRLVDDLLDAGRITQGTLVIRPEPIDLREVIEAAVESIDRLVVRRGHRLERRLPSHPVSCVGDAVRLTQVVTNLLSNAAKYTPRGGAIEVELREDREWATICVRDSGRGIPPELLPHLFEPFVRGQTTIDRRTGGLGVGLTLVQRLVELHEGRVEADSEGEGRGSEFRVVLPRDTGTSETAPAASTESRDTSSKRVLVVDDNEDAADMLTLVLRSRGHIVEVAYDGQEALDQEESFRPEIVCLDIGLPILDGYEVAERLRERRGSDLRLLAMTGYGRDADRERADRAGFDEYFVKPVAVELLEAMFEPAVGETS